MALEIYTRPNCGFCDMAKILLEKEGITFVEHEVGDLTNGAVIKPDELREQFPTMKTLPIILKDSKLIGGYSELLSYLLIKGTTNVQDQNPG